MNNNPWPPLSTTPTSFNTAKRFGVLARLTFADSTTCSMISIMSSVCFAFSIAACADSLATVKIVPSTGFITALYAVSTPCEKACANSLAFTVSFPSIALEKPRKSWDRITPELPLAPIKRPLAKSLLISSTRSDSDNDTRSAPEVKDKFMFVPVSPSGTGKTFNEFTYSAFSCRRSCATSTIALKSLAVSSNLFTLLVLLHHLNGDLSINHLKRVPLVRTRSLFLLKILALFPNYT